MAENFPNFPESSQFSGLRSLRDEMLTELARLRDIMRGDYCLEEDEIYINLPEEEKELFHEFLEFYGNCPICKSKNHDEALSKFFLSQEPENLRLRDQLLDLIYAFDPDYKSTRSHVKLGIPCCNCYKLLFEEPGVIGFRM